MITVDSITSANSSIQIIDASGNVLALTALGEIQAKITQPLPAGTNVIGGVTQSGTWTVGLSSGTNVIGHVIVDSAANVAVTSLPSLPAGANVIGAVTQSGSPWGMNLSQVGGSAITLGQAVMASSVPVAIASNQSAIPVSQSGSWTILTNPNGFGNWKITQANATSTAAQLVATPLTSRLKVEIENNGTVDVYVGTSSSVTTANGLRVPKGSSWEQALDAAANIYAVTASGTADLRIAEYAT